MNDIVQETKRPVIITVICVIGVLGALVTIPLIFSPLAREIGPWSPPFLGLATAIGLICMIGLWQMKAWAAYTYTAFFVFNQVVLTVMGVWTVSSLLIPGIVVIIIMANIAKMR